MDQKRIIAEITALKSLLAETDYNSNRLIEDLILTMQSATVTNFVSKFISWIKSAVAMYGEIIQKRAAWREQLNNLESMLTEEDE